MKRILLLLLLCAFTYSAQAKAIAENVNPGTGEITIWNVAGFAHNYSNFVISVGTTFYILNTLNVISGNLNAGVDERITFNGITIPRSAGTSIAIWYPGTTASNATSGDIIDFLQFGAAAHPYEAEAVAAGIWTAGEYISVPPPFVRTSQSHGASEWQNDPSGITDPGDLAISVLPNPFAEYITVSVPETFSGDGYAVEVADITGKLIFTREGIKESEIVLTEDLENGMFFLSVINAKGEKSTTRVVKSY